MTPRRSCTEPYGYYGKSPLDFLSRSMRSLGMHTPRFRSARSGDRRSWRRAGTVTQEALVPVIQLVIQAEHVSLRQVMSRVSFHARRHLAKDCELWGGTHRGLASSERSTRRASGPRQQMRQVRRSLPKRACKVSRKNQELLPLLRSRKAVAQREANEAARVASRETATDSRGQARLVHFSTR